MYKAAVNFDVYRTEMFCPVAYCMSLFPSSKQRNSKFFFLKMERRCWFGTLQFGRKSTITIRYHLKRLMRIAV